MPACQELSGNDLPQSPQCQFFVVRKKRLCRMTVRPGRHYCGEHEPQPRLESGQSDTRIPCPNDPKHTCYASKLQKHLSICNARAGERPPYIVPGVNAPPTAARTHPRRTLSQVPQHMLVKLIEKVNNLYDKYIKDNIAPLEEKPIHTAVLAEYQQADRAESSRRHLRQASSLLHALEAEGLVQPSTCYVELGAGKGHLSYYAWRAWCADPAAGGSRVLLVDRASLRHKRDNKLRDLAAQGKEEPESLSTDAAPPVALQTEAVSTRLRADLADLALSHVPAVQECDHLVGFAKHLCGVATDYALRCVTALGAARGLVLATCCHHRCEPRALFGYEHLQELGIDDEDMEIILGVVSWGTCGDGRSRQRRQREPEPDRRPDGEGWRAAAARAQAGTRAKALLDWARVRRLRALGFRARLLRYVPASASPENVAIVAARP